uniref:Nucleolar protein 8 n=1 Tax=Papio anubis TaxID=9555 RepID=A0A2I3M688_PAPAN
MKVNREMKHLYVGGLGQDISETDLQNQFSRFAEVSDVEITRKDDQGNPQKIFAYINISVAEADLKKCMSVLNKAKWKGGALQIQLAKESFLPRWVIEIPPLTQQQAAQKRTCDCITSSKSPPVPVSDTQKLKNLPFKTSGLETAKKRNSISNDDIDSEDELRMMIAKEENL